MKINLIQFVSYFFIGGCAAVVEWSSFYFLNSFCNLYYLVCVVISFLIATFVNYYLGKKITFKNYSIISKNREVLIIYLVSGVGLFANIVLMYIFVDLFNLFNLLSKIMATGIVFFWNFFARKLFVYKRKLEA